MGNPSGSEIALALLIVREKVSHGRSGLLPAPRRAGRNRPGNPSRRTQNTDTLRGPPRRARPRDRSLRTIWDTQSPPNAPAPGTGSRRSPAVGQRPAALQWSNVLHVCGSPWFSIRDMPDVFAKSKKAAKKNSAPAADLGGNQRRGNRLRLEKNFSPPRAAPRHRKIRQCRAQLQVRELAAKAAGRLPPPSRASSGSRTGCCSGRSRAGPRDRPCPARRRAIVSTGRAFSSPASLVNSIQSLR